MGETINSGQGDEVDIRDWLTALIEDSNDAIISKDLSGRILSWNAGATNIFGYTSAEALGKPISILIPDDRRDEEPNILSQIRDGKRVQHFETIRRRKNGTDVEISLTISPIKNPAGEIVGASKIARDISEKRRSEERLLLLVGEMQHRIKNLFSLANAVVSLSARSSSSTEEVISTIRQRLSALARAHELTLTNWTDPASGEGIVDLFALIETILEPYKDADRLIVSGIAHRIDSKRATSVALLIHELATNAAKYGSLSVGEGRLTVLLKPYKGAINIVWEEFGGPEPIANASPGFGSRLESGLLETLGATITRDWTSDGLRAVISLPE